MMPYVTRWFVYAKILPFWWVFVYVTAIFCAQVCNLLFQYHTNLKCYDFGIRVRASLTTLIYRKSLFTPMGRTQTSGMVVNLISTDAQILLETLPFFIQGALAPIQIAVTLGLLSRYLHAFSLISLAVAVVAGPLSGILAGNLGFQMGMIQKKGDVRLKLVKEFLTAIRIVKYYAWEVPFLNNISKARLDQLAQVRSFLVGRAWLISILTNVPGVGIGLTFFFYGIKNSMNFEGVFSSLAYLNMLAIPFIFLPMLIAFSAQYFASLRRIEFFGLRSELVPREISSEYDDDDEDEEGADSHVQYFHDSVHPTPKKKRSESDDDGDINGEGAPPKKHNKKAKSGKKLLNRPKGGMYIAGAAFSWETQLSIAEGKFIDLENKETLDQAAVNVASDAAEKKKMAETLEHTKTEKAHIANIIRSIKRQIAAGTHVYDVNIDEEEKDCIDANGVSAADEEDGEATAPPVANGDVDDDGLEDVPLGDESPAKKSKKKKAKKAKKEGEDGAAHDGEEKEENEQKKTSSTKFAKLRRPVINLEKLDFDVRKGTLTMVVGAVGSGKSTLAMAFMGEVHQRGGEVKVFEEFAYSSQEAWILNATIRDNITFGSPFVEERYEDVVRSCALAPDFDSFPASDLTEIGERGINLSGGQKQRINVARAMYSKSPIVILDDPFSAVDAHVGEHMFEHVAKGMRNAGRTVLLITNQLHFVPDADYIGVIKSGQMVEQGNFAELSEKPKGALAKMLAKQRKREDDVAMTGEGEGGGSLHASAASVLKHSAASGIPAPPPTSSSKAVEVIADGSTTTATISAAAAKDDELQLSQMIAKVQADSWKREQEAMENKAFKVTLDRDEENRRKGALILVEERETGNIGWRTYWNYMKSGSLWILSLYLLIQMSNTALRVFSGIWLSWWADPLNAHHFTKGEYLGGYMGIVLGQAFFTCTGALIFVFFSVNTGKTLHSIMISNVAKAPTGWYDRTPLGRIIARFSKDISLVDLELPSMFDQCIYFIFALLGLFASLATGTAYVLIIIGVAFLAFGALTIHYRQTSIQVQRVEALSRAPIFSHFAETLEGAVTIRAFRMAPIFRVANMNKIDVNNVDFLGLRYCSMWFAITLDMLGAVTVAISLMAMVLVRYYAPNSVNIGFIIYAVSQTGSVTQTLAAASQMVTDLENKMNSVERILQYTKVENEGPFEVPDNKPEPSWPAQGHIVIEDLSIEYKKNLPALKHLNCEFKPREKVGIVGRTGAGKSTLITALFRTVEPSTGRIIIDDIDVSKIGLTDLRSKLSIIPQTPQLFVGTVRYNLDPFEEHQDEELWRVLKMAKLKKHIKDMDGGLLAAVEENGSNFSVGQRQLLAMARCLLRETHVLLLDEATAAVDVETDALLQRMIRKNFKDKTVLTIAHRLNTIMDSDRILVLDAGEIVEFDTPKRLLKNKNGVLYSMVEATGPVTASYLRDIANRKSSGP